MSSRVIAILVVLIMAIVWVTEAVIDSPSYSREVFGQQLFHPDGREILGRSFAALVFCGLLIIVNGIYRKRIREVHAENIRHNQNLISASPEGIVIHHNERVLFANDRALELLHHKSLSELVNKSVMGYIHPDYRQLAISRLATVRGKNATSQLVESRLVLLDGTTVDVEISSANINYSGKPALVSYFRDITNRANIRRDLVRSRERLRLALKAARDGVWDWDIPSERMVFNRTWTTTLGYNASEITQKRSDWIELLHPDDRARNESLIQAHMRNEIPIYETEIRLRHKRGHYLWVLDRGQVVERDANNQPIRMTGTHRDITPRKEAEIALEIRNQIAEVFLTGIGLQKFFGIVDIVCRTTNSGLGMIAMLDNENKLTLMATRPRLDQNTRINSPTIEFKADEFPELFDKLISQQRTFINNDSPIVPHCPIKLDNLLVVPITNRRQIIGVICIANKPENFSQTDQYTVESLSGYLAPILESHIQSEIKESQLRQAQKMEALGSLAGGIAHDFNNIMQAIMGFASLALEEASEDSLIHSDLTRVLRATHRGQDLVKRILLFSRREEVDREEVDAYQVISEAIDLLRPSIPDSIKITTELQNGCGKILADYSQISRILLNLIKNAVQAMDTQAGQLRIELALHEDAAVLEGLDLPESLHGNSVLEISVSDNGCGISEEELSRLYDPFFTTKEVGQGSGLGLSVVHGIVTVHGGCIRINSAQGQGTTVRVFFPSHSEEKVAQQPSDIASSGVLTGRKVLFVDDEDDITDIGKAMLSRLGCQVTALNNSDRALEIIRNDPAEFDLVITDLTMPGLTGIQLAEEIAVIRDDLPILLITGVRKRPGPPLETNRHICAIVRKPFDGDELRRTVCRILMGEDSQEELNQHG